ncbi:AMP-binding protein [Streptomyces tricolor]|nr:AMP-binding protein [Streptomyces tricolor]
MARDTTPGLRRAEPARQPASAHHLIARGAGPEDVVAVRLPRTSDLMTALLAVLKARHPAPPGPRTPARAAGPPVADARPHTLLTGLDAVPWGPAARPGSDRHRPDPALLPRHTAYIVYTSGSTGRPKGVAVEHRQLVNLCHDHRAGPARPAHRPGERRGPRSAPPSPSTPPGKDLLLLALGHEVHLVDEDVRLDPEAFCAQVAEDRLDLVNVTLVPRV